MSTSGVVLSVLQDIGEHNLLAVLYGNNNLYNEPFFKMLGFMVNMCVYPLLCSKRVFKYKNKHFTRDRMVLTQLVCAVGCGRRGERGDLFGCNHTCSKF